jgi:probable FeS assembly SUF system protein SufT
MNTHEPIQLSREVEAIRIPSGDTLTLPEGSTVVVTQSLGGSYTVALDTGQLARISGADADALGIESDQATQASTAEAHDKAALEGEELKEAIWEQLKTCYDPEIPVNIVDLGLVYDCEVQEDGSMTNVEVKMTLTAPGCGMGPSIAADVQRKIMTLPGVDSADVDLVWDPPWNQDMISEEGKMKLGMV